MKIIKIDLGSLFYPLANFVKLNDIASLPCGSVRDLDDKEITAISGQWVKTLAKHWCCTLSSYNPSPADTAAKEWDASDVGERNR